MAHPKRILVLQVQNPPEAFLRRLFIGLGRRHHLVIGFTSKCSSFKHKGITPIYTPHWTAGRIKKFVFFAAQTVRCLVFFPKTSFKLFTLLWRNKRLKISVWYQILTYIPYLNHKTDWIYIPWNGTGAQFPELFSFKIKTLISCRGAHVNIAPYNPRRITQTRAIRKSLGNSTHIHCVSNHIRKTIQAWGCPETKISVIPPSVDVQFFSRSQAKINPKWLPSFKSSDFRILATGSLIWRKGWGFLLDAIELCRRRSFPVSAIIIGEGRERQKLQYMIRKKNLDSSVSLPGFLSEDEIRDLLFSSQLFISTSWSEGISNAVLEAMSMELPVISTQVGGMEEVIQNRKNGLLIKPGDSAGLAEAIQELIQQPALRQRLAQNARETITANFSLTQHIKGFSELFDSVQ